MYGSQEHPGGNPYQGEVAFWVTHGHGHRHSGLGEVKPQNFGKGSQAKALEGKVYGDSGPRHPLWSGLNRTFPNSKVPHWLPK